MLAAERGREGFRIGVSDRLGDLGDAQVGGRHQGCRALEAQAPQTGRGTFPVPLLAQAPQAFLADPEFAGQTLQRPGRGQVRVHGLPQPFQSAGKTLLAEQTLQVKSHQREEVGQGQRRGLFAQVLTPQEAHGLGQRAPIARAAGRHSRQASVAVVAPDIEPGDMPGGPAA